MPAAGTAAAAAVADLPEPAERNFQPPLGRWNLYVGGAGSTVPGYINVDLFPLPGVDVVCDAARLPFRDEIFERVELDAVLEHTADPRAIVGDIRRCLAPGGWLHAVVPFCHPFHEYPRDYFRFTPDGLALVVAPLDVVASVGAPAPPRPCWCSYWNTRSCGSNGGP